MIVKTKTGAYKAPECVIEGTLYEDFLCQSPTGSTEDFTEQDPFTW